MASLCVALASLVAMPAIVSAQQAPDHPAILAGRAFDAGQFDEVDRLAATYRGEPTIAVVHARALAARGRYGEAEQIFQAQSFEDPTGEAALELGVMYLEIGRRLEARRALQILLTSPIDPADPRATLRVARAAKALGRFDDANRLFREAVARASHTAEANTAWGELFLEKYNRQDAVRSFKAALADDPGYAPAHLGMARAVADENPPLAERMVRQILEDNPRSIGALVLLAELELDAGRHEAASEAVTRAHAVNPYSLPAWALAAAIAWADGDEATYNEAVAAALEVNPLYGEVYRVVGAAAARKYRFDEAADLARRGVLLDRDNARAYADLGVHLMRTGDERTARGVLELAFRVDPYNQITFNLLELLDTLQSFETIRDRELVVKLHPDEAPVMREQVPALARQAFDDLSARWNFTPTGPILIEMFPVHDDFAVRNVGLTGLIGALGACFGRVVTMDSPRARPPGTFNWGETLWHEIAHVVTLQLSKQRVPRWLTEGISVYEERRARPEWGREMEIPFAQALARGPVLPIRDLGSGFTNPELISLSYYQASLVVDHLMARFGQPAVRRLVQAYADGRDEATTIRAALGVDLDDLQATFDVFLQERFGALRLALAAPEALAPGLPLEALAAMADAHPGSFPAQLALADALAESRPAEAIARFERAAALVPNATGPESPHARIAELATALGDTARAAAAYAALTSHDPSDLASARAWTALIDPAADPDAAQIAYARVVAIDPFDASAHAALGKLAREAGKTGDAVRHFTVALAAGPLDRASAHADLAESLVDGGDRDAAKRQTLSALEIAPTYERAQELLLRLVGGGQ
ncbi:MAG: peptidase MA family metallohydrolase [Vicinamibacterales bacterium]|nr:peptidase MA family metallohydrolase [Vicinamibacterales bacterium]